MQPIDENDLIQHMRMIPYACRISGFEVLVLRGKKQAGYLEPV
jgi:hypothetical protein